jgi:hypothetical protein
MLIKIFSICTIICIIILSVSSSESYSSEEDIDMNMYNYSRENPNALQHGKNISGVVYSDYPYSIPGLGWIL